jgi:hypothetical protein
MADPSRRILGGGRLHTEDMVLTVSWSFARPCCLDGLWLDARMARVCRFFVSLTVCALCVA